MFTKSGLFSLHKYAASIDEAMGFLTSKIRPSLANSGPNLDIGKTSKKTVNITGELVQPVKLRNILKRKAEFNKRAADNKTLAAAGLIGAGVLGGGALAIQKGFGRKKRRYERDAEWRQKMMEEGFNSVLNGG